MSDAETAAAFKLEIDENERMSSNWEHRAWVWGTSALLAKPFLLSLMSITDAGSGALVFLALVASYYMAGELTIPTPFRLSFEKFHPLPTPSRDGLQRKHFL